MSTLAPQYPLHSDFPRPGREAGGLPLVVAGVLGAADGFDGRVA